MKVEFSIQNNNKSDVLILAVPKDGTDLSPNVKKSLGEIADAVELNVSSDAKFKGTTAQTMTFAAPKGSGYKKVVLVSLGEKPDNKNAVRAAGSSAYGVLKATGYETADVMITDGKSADFAAPESAAVFADAANAASYSFDKYITDERSSQAKPQSLKVLTSNAYEADQAYKPLSEITYGEQLAADMANEPGNVMYPESAAQRIIDEFSGIKGINIKILDEKKMKTENMNAALAVGQGSTNPPRMVVIEYDGTDGAEKGWPVALVGKGVTFDTGGISLKPGAGMQDMKMDMGGAAAVTGAMRALAGRGAKTKVVAILGFAENMPDGKSYRPGDILTTRSGKTVNVGNTDAEGRLVLCDAIDYIQDEYKPKTMVDLATLTGAIVSALAHTYSGVFSNNDRLWSKLDKAGKESGQPGWRMPLHENFARAVRGTFADLENSAKTRYGGASTAAEFLRTFVKASTKSWAHLDIAGTAIPANGISNGHGVRWLNQFISNNFEKKDPVLPNTPPKPSNAP